MRIHSKTTRIRVGHGDIFVMTTPTHGTIGDYNGWQWTAAIFGITGAIALWIAAIQPLYTVLLGAMEQESVTLALAEVNLRPKAATTLFLLVLGLASLAALVFTFLPWVQGKGSDPIPRFWVSALMLLAGLYHTLSMFIGTENPGWFRAAVLILSVMVALGALHYTKKQAPRTP